MNIERLDKLTTLGLLFNGQAFVYDDINFHWTDIVCMTDEEFDKAYNGAVERLEILKKMPIIDQNYNEVEVLQSSFKDNKTNLKSLAEWENE